jgi:hypothetical protein
MTISVHDAEKGGLCVGMLALMISSNSECAQTEKVGDGVQAAELRVRESGQGLN